jgi:hypothetical protein
MSKANCLFVLEHGRGRGDMAADEPVNVLLFERLV